jgi:hypothetical protein
MKNYLCTLNVNHDVMHPNSRESLMAAARRWRAQYVEIVSPSPGEPHHYFQKLMVERQFPDDARVCFLDADTIIRSDCPDLFKIVPEEELGLVRSWQPGHECGEQSVVSDWCQRRGLPDLDITQEYHNGGLIIFSTTHHRECLRRAVAKMEEAPHECIQHWEIGDQAPLSAVAKELGIPIRWLAPCFNRFGAELWHGWTPTMTDYIWHFCGPISKQIASRCTSWQEHGPDRITGQGRTRWRLGAPYMLNDNGLELPFLHQTLRYLPSAPAIVEVGSWLGGSAYHFVKGTEDLQATIHCVDHWCGDPVLNPAGGEMEDIYQGFLTNLKEMGAPTNVVIHRKPSTEAAQEFTNASLDMVYLDGSHDHDSVRQDLQAWWPKLKDGGIIAGHDYSEQHFPGLVQAVDDFFGGKKVETSEGGYSMWRLRKQTADPTHSRRIRDEAALAA